MASNVAEFVHERIKEIHLRVHEYIVEGQVNIDCWLTQHSLGVRMLLVGGILHGKWLCEISGEITMDFYSAIRHFCYIWLVLILFNLCCVLSWLHNYFVYFPYCLYWDVHVVRNSKSAICSYAEYIVYPQLIFSVYFVWFGQSLWISGSELVLTIMPNGIQSFCFATEFCFIYSCISKTKLDVC